MHNNFAFQKLLNLLSWEKNVKSIRSTNGRKVILQMVLFLFG